MKKPRKTDYVFLAVLVLCLMFHSIFLFAPLDLKDETFYATIPYRLVKGDSLIRDEWHLSQFSSFFSYLPVLFWIKVKGSAEGIVVFLRCVYLSVHTLLAATIYRFFRKYGPWAVAAALMFYLQIPYRIYAISYNSMFAAFLLLLSLCLLSLRGSPAPRYHFLAGLCYSACCVCNPLFCLAYPLWLAASRLGRKTRPVTGPRFFTREKPGYFCAGIAVTAVLCLVFFFATGGTLSSVLPNIGNILSGSEYDIVSQSPETKILGILKSLRTISFGLPLLSGLSAALLLDKKRRQASHRLVYLSLAVLLGLVYEGGIAISARYTTYGFSLPFFVFSTVCYVLTENKNKELFYGMWCPCAVAALFHLMASNTLLSSVGIVFAVSNVAGVLFTRDLFQELVPDSRRIPAVCRRLICAAICLQLVFYGFVLQFGQIPRKDDLRAASGPLAGLHMSQSEYQDYNLCLKDLDTIRQRSRPEDPVYLYTSQNWMYLYLDRPMALHCTWFEGNFLTEDLLNYYRRNPGKIPRFIYLEKHSYSIWYLESFLATAQEWFDYTLEELPAGILLTVHGSKLP